MKKRCVVEFFGEKDNLLLRKILLVYKKKNGLYLIYTYNLKIAFWFNDCDCVLCAWDENTILRFTAVEFCYDKVRKKDVFGFVFEEYFVRREG